MFKQRNIIIIAFSLIMVVSGCIQPTRDFKDFANKKQLLEYLFEGYDEKQPFLYYDRFPMEGSRLLTLTDELADEQYHFGLWQNTDGSSLYFTQMPVFPDTRSEEKCLIISAESPPRVVTFPKGAMLDMHGNIVATRIKTNDGTRTIEFPDGYVLPSSRNILDLDRRYFCANVQNAETDVSNTCEDETFIYSFKNPQKPLIKVPYISMKQTSWMFSTDSELYLMYRDVKDKGEPDGLKVYIYKRNQPDEALILERSFQIQCPRLLFAERLYPFAVDGVNKQMIISVLKSWPYPGERFLYNIKTGRMTKLKQRLDGRVVLFFDPKILTNTVNYVSFE